MPEDARRSGDPWSKSPHFYYLSEDSGVPSQSKCWVKETCLPNIAWSETYVDYVAF